MADPAREQAIHTGRNVRLETLVRLRWLAVIGQTTAVLVVYVGLDFELPIWAWLAVIAIAAWLNVALRVRFRPTQRLEPDRAAWLLAFDIAELAILLFLTGGLQNPFAFLLLGPVLLSATALPPRMTLMLGAFAAACATVLIFYHYPLPWDPEEPLELPAIYTMGVWISLLLALGFIGVHSWQLTEEQRQLAHALGTPLSTSTVIAAELERAIEANSPFSDDVKLLREQAQRCRAILGKLTELSSSVEPFDRMPFSALLEEVVAPHRNFGVAINVALSPRDAAEPIGGRNPVILYGLGNLVENAVDFARGKVDVAADWSAEDVGVTISDDGPGFAPEIMDRIGEPYVTSTRRRRFNVAGETGGLGLGFFIAKTLLERSGATLDFENRV